MGQECSLPCLLGKKEFKYRKKKLPCNTCFPFVDRKEIDYNLNETALNHF